MAVDKDGWYAGYLARVAFALVRHFGEDEELWGNAELLHDNDVKNHGVLCKQILKNAGVSDDLINVIISHVYGTECGDYAGKIRSTRL